MPEIGLGIGHEVGTHERISRDWLYWYDEQGTRYPAQEDALQQERILRERESLIRREVEEKLATSEQTIALKLLQQGVDLNIISQATGLSMSELQDLQNP